jgi:membrane-associated phospholipid phosphatase
MLDILVQTDTDLLVWIHQQVHSMWLDSFVPLLREKWLWLPLYMFLLGFMLFNYGTRGLIWAIVFVFSVGIADNVSSKLIKNSVERLRPCHNEDVAPMLDMKIPCGGKYSFTSSHAANHFTIAFFIFFTIGRTMRFVRWPFILWAAAVGFAQVYVGVHYPLDIVGGTIVGFLIGGLGAMFFNKRWGEFTPNPLLQREEPT